MRIEALILIGVAVFFGIVGAVYWFWAYEPGGTAMLIGTTLLGLVPGSYYMWWSLRMRPRPEDRGEATIEEMGWELFRTMLDVASGRRRTWTEKWGLHNSLALFNPAPVT